MQIDPLRGVGNLVDVPSLTEMSCERTHITDLDDRLEADILLDAHRDVIRSRGIGAAFDSVQRRRRAQRGAGEIDEVVYVAEIDLEVALERRIVDQVSAGRSAARPWRVIHAELSAHDCLRSSGNVPRKAEAR